MLAPVGELAYPSDKAGVEPCFYLSDRLVAVPFCPREYDDSILGEISQIPEHLQLIVERERIQVVGERLLR